MLDTVLFYHPGPSSESTLSNLTNPRTLVDSRSGETYDQGRLQNLLVKAYEDRTIVTGSLPRFHLGSNFHTLTPDQAAEAVENISDLLLLPLDQAPVYRLDAGVNLEVNRPPSDLIRSFGYLSRHRKDSYNGTQGIAYITKKRVLIAYDKGAESRAKGREIPPQYRDKNIVRCEVQLKRRVKEQVGLRVTGGQLGTRWLHGRMLDILEEQLNKIQFLRAPLLPIAPDRALFKYSRFLLGMEAMGGIEAELNHLHEAYKAGFYQGRERVYYGLTALVRKTYSSETITKPLDAEQEFKVRLAEEIAERRRVLN